MPELVDRTVHIAAEILKNHAMGFQVVREYRRTRAGYPDVDSAVAAVRRTSEFYDKYLKIASGREDPVQGKRVLEVGPGSNLGLLLWFLARGAVSGTAIDRFPDLLPTPQLQALHHAIAARWPASMQQRVEDLVGLPAQRFERDDCRLKYRPNLALEAATHQLSGQFDIVVSYGVLGLIRDIPGTSRELYRLLSPGGVMVHRVHHGTHGRIDGVRAGILHQYTYSERLWQMMYSNRGGPNRQPARAYRKACQEAGLEDVQVIPVQQVPINLIERSRPLLHPQFRTRSAEDLCIHASALLARRP